MTLNGNATTVHYNDVMINVIDISVHGRDITANDNEVQVSVNNHMVITIRWQ